MRNKVAKKLRKDANTMFGHALPYVEYETVGERTKMYFNHLTMQFDPVTVSTQILGSCVRAMYQDNKRKYKKGLLKRKK